MNKKILSIMAILALVTGSIFADVVQDTVPTFVEGTTSISGETGSTVVADASDVAMSFELEASTDEGTTWANANGQYVYDNTANAVRDGFTVNFRVRATNGSYSIAKSFNVNVLVGDLYRGGNTSEYNAGSGTVDSATLGSGFSGTLSITSPSSDTDLPFSTLSNRTYGVDSTQANDSIEFNIGYDGDSNAPAGQYQSTVTVAYTVVS